MIEISSSQARKENTLAHFAEMRRMAEEIVEVYQWAVSGETPPARALPEQIQLYQTLCEEIERTGSPLGGYLLLLAFPEDDFTTEEIQALLVQLRDTGMDAGLRSGVMGPELIASYYAPAPRSGGSDAQHPVLARPDRLLAADQFPSVSPPPFRENRARRRRR